MRLFGFDIELVDEKGGDTNRDMLREMDNEQLAYFVSHHCCPPNVMFTGKCSEDDCTRCWVEWLNAERG